MVNNISPTAENPPRLVESKPQPAENPARAVSPTQNPPRPRPQKPAPVPPPPLSPPPTPSASPKLLRAGDYCRRAFDLFRKKQFASAQKILQRGLLEVEKKASAYHLLGLCLYYQGFFGPALNALKKACSMESRPEYLLNLSIVLNELGKYNKAQAFYEKALQLKTLTREQNWKRAVAEKHYQTGALYLKNQHPRSALKEYIKGLHFYSTPGAQTQTARLLYRLNQKLTAFKYLTKVISQHPRYIPARLLFADWCFEEKKFPLAVNEWENILIIDPQNRQALDALTRAQALTERF